MRLSQIRAEAGHPTVVVTQDGASRKLDGPRSLYELAMQAIAGGRGLAEEIGRHRLGDSIDLTAALSEGRVLSPLGHPDPAHTFVTGTGLTHLGSAEGRDRMHRDLADATKLTDSMKMFRMGLAGGRPGPGETGVQPEWFYKGDGSMVVAPEGALPSPGFALDGGEEPEVVGLYVIAPDGAPHRLGFALGNEFSDHVTERQNYLFLAHSKLRPCAFGPEILVGELPQDIRGASRIRRNDALLWEKPFVSGEANMSHAIANLEHHHFKYALFRRPGDVHVHFFGTATLSFSDGIRPEQGDIFEIECPEFGLPLRNRLGSAATPRDAVRVL